jgi:hypothetical protein
MSRPMATPRDEQWWLAMHAYWGMWAALWVQDPQQAMYLSGYAAQHVLQRNLDVARRVRGGGA